MEELKAEIKSLYLLMDKTLNRALNAEAIAKTAEKTADKALAMAQEALVIITSGKANEEVFKEAGDFQDFGTPSVRDITNNVENLMKQDRTPKSFYKTTEDQVLEAEGIRDASEELEDGAA